MTEYPLYFKVIAEAEDKENSWKSSSGEEVVAGLASVIPGLANPLFKKFAVPITLVTIGFQTLALHLMNCFE